jgi:hypothetical protein
MSDLVYQIRIGKKLVNINVEQLKFCRTPREQLRESRRQWRRELRRSDADLRSSRRREAELDSSSEEEPEREYFIEPRTLAYDPPLRESNDRIVEPQAGRETDELLRHVQNGTQNAI